MDVTISLVRLLAERSRAASRALLVACLLSLLARTGLLSLLILASSSFFGSKATHSFAHTDTQRQSKAVRNGAAPADATDWPAARAKEKWCPERNGNAGGRRADHAPFDLVLQPRAAAGAVRAPVLSPRAHIHFLQLTPKAPHGDRFVSAATRSTVTAEQHFFLLQYVFGTLLTLH